MPETSPTAPDTPAALGETDGLFPAILTVGFATTVAIWVIAYLCLMGPGLVLGEALFAMMLLCLLGGGIVMGRVAGGGLMAGGLAGFVSGLLNLLIIGSLVGGKARGELATAAALWGGGTLIGSIVLGVIGAVIGRMMAPLSPRNWMAGFAMTTVTAVLLLLITGGVVTGFEAGLAVEDWPTSFGHNMFLYPVTEMIGGRFYEHAHRLYGSLVGLTTLMLMISLLTRDRRGWLKVLGVLVFLAVCIQGLMGGFRVTELSITLAIVHGVFAQLVFATIVSIAAFVSTTWISSREPIARESYKSDRKLSASLPAALLVQLILGAMYRHLNADPDVATGLVHGALGGHLLMAAIVTVKLLLVAGRAWILYRDEPIIARIGAGLMILIGIQLLLGTGALVTVLIRDTADTMIPWYEVLLTTAHQTTGALLLAGSVLLAVWMRRLVRLPA